MAIIEFGYNSEKAAKGLTKKERWYIITPEHIVCHDL
jgi:hypothetical protein